MDEEKAISDTKRWLEKAVIGLNLCPFAKSVHVRNQIHYHVYLGKDSVEWLAALRKELVDLQAMDPDARDTSLLIAPNCFGNFLDFNEFLSEAEMVLAELELEGQLQIANFHPQFQFSGTQEDDITNYTNRAPYPTLHLIRESSIDRAVAAFPDAERIYLKNIETLQKLGLNGWFALGMLAP